MAGLASSPSSCWLLLGMAMVESRGEDLVVEGILFDSKERIVFAESRKRIDHKNTGESIHFVD